MYLLYPREPWVLLSTVLLQSSPKLQSSIGVGGGVQGVQAHPHKFSFVENLGKIPENLCKIRTKFSNI